MTFRRLVPVLAADVVFILGVALVLVGVYLQLGLPASLIVVGVFLIVASFKLADLEDSNEPGQEDL